MLRLTRGLLIAALAASSSIGWCDEPHSLFSVSGAPHPGLALDSELGLVLTAGNSQSGNVSLRQQSSYRWIEETVGLMARYLEASAGGVESARNWGLGARYERRIVHHLGGFVGQSIEADPFAGYTQRYATDLGLRRTLWSAEKTKGATELGYRYQLENRVGQPRLFSQILRVYVEGVYRWNPKVTGLISVEALPDVKSAADWMLNSDLSIEADLSGPLSLKTTYSVRYQNTPAAPGLKTTDSSLTTALVAKL